MDNGTNPFILLAKVTVKDDKVDNYLEIAKEVDQAVEKSEEGMLFHNFDRDPDNENIFILLTSTTLSSSQLIEKKKFNKNTVQHRFFPLDVQFLIKKFLNHWKPDMAIFVDSEIWPNYLFEISKRKIPLVLLNGRITMKTFKRWKLVSNLSLGLFGLYLSLIHI